MAISRFSTSRVGAGLPKYQKLWDGTTTYSSTAYESISTVTVGAGGSSTVTFSSIPSTYKHLQIRCISRDSTSSYYSNDLYMTYNGDTNANYSLHRLYGTGSAAMADSVASASYMLIGQNSTSLATSGMFGVNVIDILEYANTSIFKTARGLGGVDLNGNTDGRIMLQSGNWRSTSVITSITLRPASGTLSQYSSFALYGIKG